jgi:hypothetical protein
LDLTPISLQEVAAARTAAGGRAAFTSFSSLIRFDLWPAAPKPIICVCRWHKKQHFPFILRLAYSGLKPSLVLVGFRGLRRQGSWLDLPLRVVRPRTIRPGTRRRRRRRRRTRRRRTRTRTVTSGGNDTVYSVSENTTKASRFNKVPASYEASHVSATPRR